MNKATLLVAELKKLLKPLQPVINSTAVLPILEDVLIEFSEDVMKITVTDLETVVTATTTVPMVSAPFSFCVDFKMFKSLIDKCDCENLTLESKTGRVIFKSAEPEFSLELPSESPSDYPKTAVLADKEFDFSVAAREIIPYLKIANLFTSHDDLRPSMTGICMMNYEDHLTYVATDAHRLYKRKIFKMLDIKGGFDKTRQYILPQKSVKVMCGLFNEGFTMRGNANHTECFDPTYRIIMRNIDARYPDWQQVWPKKLDYSFYAIRKKFKAALELAHDFTNKSTRQVKFILSEHHVALVCGDIDFSIDFNYRLAIYENKMGSDSFTFAVNSFFLNQAAGITKDVNIRIRYESQIKAFIIDDDILLMPLMSHY